MKVESVDVTYEGAIIDAIRWAKEQDRKIVKLGIPPKIQVKLLQMIDTSHNLVDYLHIKEVFGIPVEDSNKLQITLEIKGGIK